MDFATMMEWLKTTIPGIVILGMLGSLLAALILWAIPKFFPSIKSAFKAAFVSILKHFAVPAAKSLARMILKKNDMSLHAFFALQIMKAALALSVGSCAFVLFVLAVNDNELVLFRSGVLVPLVILILSLWHLLRIMGTAIMPLYVDMKSLIDEVIEEMKNESEKR